ncbi:MULTISPECIES: hypothetical protein [Haloarcula]|uniref:Uncharacterized protein n=1 Tax=Haloarcula pellucida TaxID=1427151 RepID=A0A830GT24_9EURY|nr:MULTISPECIES: hypothetical protein [Halomicroarcula]MBX0350545.1 hypothetical protein [Halomicroarcula pellucida]MDS0280310.1 hypothetical protein [Halomicroarcula sp. S1AR25-4]GGO03831.1 hypothetical protein GCM10009030_39920 [Halomicroarcula pellucida]
MKVTLSRDLYHDPDGDCPILQMVGHKSPNEYLDEDELAQSDHEPCEGCFPNRVE